MVKNLPAVQETCVRSLGWEDPLEEGMANHSSILAWKSPWTEEPGGLQSVESQSWTRLNDSMNSLNSSSVPGSQAFCYLDASDSYQHTDHSEVAGLFLLRRREKELPWGFSG